MESAEFSLSESLGLCCIHKLLHHLIGDAWSLSLILEETLKASGADVLVDFTIAHAAVDTIKRATGCGVSVVVGTTGMSEEQMEENIKNIKENRFLSRIIGSPILFPWCFRSCGILP